MEPWELTAGWTAAQELLCRSQRVVITTHIHPDGDGIGSALALQHYLRLLGKEASCLLHSSVPTTLLFLPGAEEILCYRPEHHGAVLAAADVVVIVDTSELRRLGTVAEGIERTGAVKLVIDHHLAPQPFADVYVVDPHASATGELVWQLLQRMGGQYRTPEIALCLYTAIMTDTGSFAYSNTSAHTHRTIAELVDIGVDIPWVHEQLFHSWSLARMHLLGQVLATMELHAGGRISLLVVPQEAFHQTGAQEEDVEGLAHYTLSVRGVSIGLLVVELPQEGGIKISFRSRKGIPVHGLAAEFGGGGHEYAAGARLPAGDMRQLCRYLVERTAAYLRELAPEGAQHRAQSRQRLIDDVFGNRQRGPETD